MLQKNITYISSFPRWGCYAASLFSLAERHLGQELSPVQVKAIWQKALSAGYVWDNKLPTDGSQGKWYRCFVYNPIGFGNIIFQHLGLKLRLKSVTNSPTPASDFTLICYQTKWGVHFALGNAQGKAIVNPDPDLPLIKIDSYRVFTLIK